MPNTTSGADRANTSASASALHVGTPDSDRSPAGTARRLTVDELVFRFDVMADLADMAGDEEPIRMGNLVWVIGQLAEKFGRDVETLRGEVCHD